MNVRENASVPMMRTNVLIGIQIVLLLLLNISAPGQETYYWNIQYGTRSTLLGGAVIGSASDLSATYYNPGAIALFKEAKFILSARVYQLDNYLLKDGAAEGVDLDFSTLTPSPSFLAFDFDFDFLGNDKLALSILTRQSSDFEFRTRLIDSIDVIGSSPGEETFAGGFRLEKKFNDVWGGATYSTRLSTMIGLGFTWYFSYSSFRTSGETILQALQSTGDIASYTEVHNYSFNNLRTLWKAGIGFNLNPLTLGFTVTTPSANIGGSGSVGTHRFLSGVDSTIFESNYQDDVKSQYKSAWAVGFGGAYRFGDLNLHMSGEWYQAVDPYYVVDTESFVAQGSGEILTNDLTHEAKSITNFGIGLEYSITEKVLVAGSFVTDFSARVANTETNMARANTWDVYHISAGTSFPVGRSEITLGLSYSFGSDDFENTIDRTPDPDDEAGTTRITKVVFNRIKVLFGFVI